MPLYVTRNGTDWTPASEGEGASGPCWGFDTDNNTPVFRSPEGVWMNALGEPVGYVGQLSFSNPKNAALWSLL